MEISQMHVSRLLRASLDQLRDELRALEPVA
jgi:DNA-directed RNA polymerase specialized sigma subunit